MKILNDRQKRDWGDGSKLAEAPIAGSEKALPHSSHGACYGGT